MKLDITFGLNLDGVLYPAGVENLNEARFGEKSFLAFLESRTGIFFQSGGFTAARIVAYQNAMRQAEEVCQRFYSASFSEMSDAWASAETLLSWRDSLLMGGWDAVTDFPKNNRLHTFYELEKFDGFKNGFADRLQSVLKALPAFDPDISSVRLTTPFGLLPVLWQKVFSVLKDKGIKVSEDETVPAVQPEVTYLLSDNEQTGCEVIAQWLSLSEKSPQKPLLITGANNAILNNALAKRNLPELESNTSSSLRSLLQVLPSVIDLMEKPFSPQKLYDFLRLPSTPLGKNAVKLSHVLEQFPGKDGMSWNETLSGLKSTQKDVAWDYWLNLSKYDDKVPVKALLDVCDKLEVWLNEAKADPLKAAASEQVGHFKEVVSLYNAERIKFSQVRKILRSVLDAVDNPFALERKAAPYFAVSHPAKILGSADIAVWTDFRDKGNIPVIYPWTLAEEKALNAAGVFPDTKGRVASRYSLECKNALKAKKLIVLILKSDKGAEFNRHPFGDELDGTADVVEVSSDKDNIMLAGKKISILRKKLSLDGRKPVAIGVVSKNPKRSASSMQTMIDCPLQWYFQYQLGLKSGSASMQNEYLTLGNLLHEIIERLSADKSLTSWTEQNVTALFEQTVWEQAAFLNDKGRKAEKDAVLETTLNAVSQLKAFIQDNGLKIVAVEEPLPDGEFSGFIDMHLRQGRKDVLLDMKYSSSDRYAKKLKENASVQLSLYAKATGARIAGYFLLKSNEIFMNQDGFEHAKTIESDLIGTWENVSRQAHDGLALLKTGQFFPEYKKEICEYCPFTLLCDVKKGE